MKRVKVLIYYFKILFAKILGMKEIFYAFIFFIFAAKLNLKSNL